MNQRRCQRRFMLRQYENEVVMLRIAPAQSEAAISQARTLFREYAATPGVVACLADFERELATLPGRYAPPGGRLLLAFTEQDEGEPVRGPGAGNAIGCVALRKLESDACEMKRLYVRPAVRGQGAGRGLVKSLIAEARSMG